MEGLYCPHCNEILTTIETPTMSKWAGIELELCLNDMCPYFLKSWKFLTKQAGTTVGYRYYLDSNGHSGPMAVGSVDAFKDCILTEEEKRSRKEREYREEKEFRSLIEAIDRADEQGESQLSLWLRQLRKLKYPNKV